MQSAVAEPLGSVRVVVLLRGSQGYGFTLSGQAPCLLSGVSRGGAAEQAGLRPGQFLVAVNGERVLHCRHDRVVRLIGACRGALQLQVGGGGAESSDEETVPAVRHRTPRRQRQQQQGSSGEEDVALSVVLGYVGSVDLPSAGDESLLAELGSCIRRLRQQKRVHSLTLLSVGPSGVRLRDSQGRSLAHYPSRSLALCGALADDSRFFGLVTAALSGHASCHVFMVDPRLSPHCQHRLSASAFSLRCCRLAGGHCLQFPSSSQPVLAAVAAHCGVRLDAGAAPAPSSSNSDSGVGVREEVRRSRRHRHHGSPPSAPANFPYARRPDPALSRGFVGRSVDDLRSPDQVLLPPMAGSDSEISVCRASLSASSRRLSYSWTGRQVFSVQNAESEEFHSCQDNPTKLLSTRKRLSSSSHHLSSARDESCDPAVDGSSIISDSANSSSRVQSWTKGLAHVLADPAGLHTFSEFLKSQFSHENVYFWVGCERYRTASSADHASIARSLYERHLCEGAAEPVNVNAEILQGIENGLSAPDETLFDSARDHIFKLMMYDCYPRFLKSTIFEDCLFLEKSGEPLPYLGDDKMDQDLNLCLNHNCSSNDSKEPLKSGKNGETRRKFTLLHWSRSKAGNKDRLKSKERLKSSELGESSRSHRTLPTMFQRRAKCRRDSSVHGVSAEDSGSIASDLTGSHTSLTSEPLANRDSLFSVDGGGCCEHDCAEEGCRLCRVLLPDGSCAVVRAEPGVTVRALLQQLLRRRHLHFGGWDVYQERSNRPISQSQQASRVLAGNTVRLEQRVLFQLTVPTAPGRFKSMAVKAKPSRRTCDVLAPLLDKHSLDINSCVLLEGDAGVSELQPQAPVTLLDNKHVHVRGTLADSCRQVEEVTNGVYRHLLLTPDHQSSVNGGCHVSLPLDHRSFHTAGSRIHQNHSDVHYDAESFHGRHDQLDTKIDFDSPDLVNGKENRQPQPHVTSISSAPALTTPRHTASTSLTAPVADLDCTLTPPPPPSPHVAVCGSSRHAATPRFTPPSPIVRVRATSTLSPLPPPLPPKPGAAARNRQAACLDSTDFSYV